jgi:hypothetical protein
MISDNDIKYIKMLQDNLPRRQKFLERLAQELEKNVCRCSSCIFRERCVKESLHLDCLSVIMGKVLREERSLLKSLKPSKK